MEKQYSKDYFQLVQDSDRLLDKPLKTKQLTYFQDAMLRFGKNKYNVIASIILLVMILMSIIVPMITPPRFYEITNSELTTLPPRMPLIEHLGILDGTKEFKDQPIEYDTIDPETGLGYPGGDFLPEYIDFSTLSNRIIDGNERSPYFVGGTVDLYISAEKSRFTVVSPGDLYDFDGTLLEERQILIPADSQLVLDIAEFEEGTLKVLFVADGMFPTSWDQYTEIASYDYTDGAGVKVIDILAEVPADTLGRIALQFDIDAPSELGNERIVFNSLTLDYEVSLGDTSEEEDFVMEGYLLSIFEQISYDGPTENGRWLRNGAQMTVATFTYDVYGALFSDKAVTLGAERYQEILDANPGMEDAIAPHPEDPTNDEMWIFVGDWPITEVTGSDFITIGGVTYGNIFVLMDGKTALGFDDVPFFPFGTDVFGKDLFTLIWLGLRTSLLLGFLASLTNIVVGIVWGAISAYYGGQVDILMERFTDIWGSFPQITMIGIITVLIGPGFTALYIFLVYDGWIRVAKITRLQFYRYKGREYVLAARTLGASDRRIIFKHILPNALGTIVTRVILSIPAVIFLEVNLSFLGFGIGNGATFQIGPVNLTGTSIGVILNDGQQQIFAGNLWLIIFPTIVVSILMITFNMFGNALRDALNPQLRGSE